MSGHLTKMLKDTTKGLLNNAHRMLAQNNWSDKYSYKEIERIYTTFKEELTNTIGNITQLTKEELEELGFAQWDAKNNIYLIPLWAYDLIPNGTELVNIHGEKAIKGQSHIDLAVLSGYIPWGIQIHS